MLYSSIVGSLNPDAGDKYIKNLIVPHFAVKKEDPFD